MKATAPGSVIPRRCAIYTRKSTSAGLDKAFTSLDAQREACEAYIGRQVAWKALPKPYDDGGFTGASLDRPGFQELLRDVEEGRIDVIVVYKVDRLSRSLLDFAQVMERLNRNNVAFVSVTQNFSTADAMGRLTLNMLMSFAEFEREMIAERTRDKIAAARRKGKWTGGIVPLGYRVQDHRLVVVEDEAKLVRETFRRYLAGESTVQIAAWLNASAVPMKNQRKPLPNPWTKDRVLKILRRRLYMGTVHSHGEYFQGEQEALLDVWTFERVQERLEPRVQTRGTITRNPGYLVRGTLRCGSCGGVMTTASCTRNGRAFRYYRCVTRGKKGAGACAAKQLPAEPIEAFVVERLREAIERGYFPRKVLEDRLQSIRGQLDQARKDGEALPPEAQEDRESYLLGVEMDREVGRLEEAEGTTIWLLGVLNEFPRLWEALTPRNRQKLIQVLVARVVVDQERRVLEVQLVDLAGVA
jgi:DNA invertase Pin-like site-specific DNA recombinase